MSEAEESYFEIQLDRGTVALAGLALAAIVVLAFLLGAWWGRRATIDAVENLPVAGGADLAEDDRAAAGGAEAGDGEEADVVVDGRPPFGAEPVSARGAPPLTPVPDEPDPETTTPGPPGQGADTASGATASGSRGTTDAARDSSGTEPRRSSAATTGRGWVVQVTAVRDRSDADALRRRLAGRDWPVRIVTAGGLHKVQVGPYAARAEAEAAEKRLRTEERLATWLHRE